MKRLFGIVLFLLLLAAGSGAQAQSAGAQGNRAAKQSPSRVQAQPVVKAEPPAPLPPAAARVQEPQLSEASKAVAIQSLLGERADWQSKDTGIAGPLVLTAVGAGVLIGSLGLQVAYQESGYYYSADDNHPGDGALNTASIALGIGGGVVTAGAILWWAMRTTQARQERELQRIDQQLQGLGISAKVTPWFAPSAKQVAGGLSLTLRL
jgi:hypothetical protein